MAVPLTCPLCESENKFQTVVTKHVYGSPESRKSSFFKCEKCGVIYQYPGLTQEEESIFYANEFESFMSKRSGESGGWETVEKHIAANEANKERRMNYLIPHLKNNSKIIEFGCSSGFMLHPLLDKGHTCLGIEPSGVFRNDLLKSGIKVYESIDELLITNDTKFDLIIHFFVLEHISDPLNFLSKQINLLEKGGKIIFEIPNSADPLFSIYDISAFERFYWSVAHPWYFNEKSLNYLLSRLELNYEIIRDQRYDLSNHLIWARDGKPGGMGRFTDKFGKNIEEIYKKELIKHGYCDTLIAVISK